MTEPERDAVQRLISAAIRIVRTPMAGVAIDCPLARAVFGLALQLAAAGFINVEEAQRAAETISADGLNEVMGDVVSKGNDLLGQ